MPRGVRGREAVVVDGVGGEKLRVEVEEERLLRGVVEKEYYVFPTQGRSITFSQRR